MLLPFGSGIPKGSSDSSPLQKTSILFDATEYLIQFSGHGDPCSLQRYRCLFLDYGLQDPNGFSHSVNSFFQSLLLSLSMFLARPPLSALPPTSAPSSASAPPSSSARPLRPASSFHFLSRFLITAPARLPLTVPTQKSIAAPTSRFKRLSIWIPSAGDNSVNRIAFLESSIQRITEAIFALDLLIQTSAPEALQRSWVNMGQAINEILDEVDPQRPKN